MNYGDGGLSASDVALLTGRNDNCNSGFGNNGDNAWWIILFLIFGLGRNGFGNGFGGNYGANSACATPADVRSAVDQQTLISKIDQQTYGLADTFNSLNNTLNSNFRGIDNAVCNLGFQAQQNVNALSSQLASCCCDIREGIQSGITQGVMNTNTIQNQIASCCCNLEKANMQNRFDAQTYNCNTLQAIDKLGDRIINHLNQDKIDTLTSENQALRLKASQEAQNTYLLNELKPCPIPAYITCNPNASYNFGFGSGCGFNGFGFNNCSGCNNF